MDKHNIMIVELTTGTDVYIEKDSITSEWFKQVEKLDEFAPYLEYIHSWTNEPAFF
jgi:hypothetical protein